MRLEERHDKGTVKATNGGLANDLVMEKAIAIEKQI